MKTSKIESKNKIIIKGDRKEPIIEAIADIRIHHPEFYKELKKVIDYELWDGYSLMIHEEESDETYLKVCEHCLMAIESREGYQPTIKHYIEANDTESKCMWCGETADEGDFDCLYEFI